MASVYYMGDSTVCFNRIDTYPQMGMSNTLSLYLKPGVMLYPHGHNGRSTKSFLDEGHFEPVKQGLCAGDLLLIQFGHNDEKPDEARHTDPETSFRDNLRCYIYTAREKGAYPVLITPIGRRLFDGQGNFLPGSHGAYPDAIRAVGREENVPVADMTAITEKWLAQLGDEPSKPLFVWPKDNTHLKFDGARILSGFLAEEIRKMGSPYADFILD